MVVTYPTDSFRFVNVSPTNFEVSGVRIDVNVVAASTFSVVDGTFVLVDSAVLGAADDLKMLLSIEWFWLHRLLEMGS